MGVDGIPTTADGRAGIAMEDLLPAAERAGIPVEDVFLDPLVLAVNCNQDVAMETVEAVRMFKMMADPPPTTVIGLSNISNGALPEVRPLINRVMMVMAMGAGLDSAIADPLDSVQNEWIRIAEQHDDSTPLGKLIVALYDAVAAMDKLDPVGRRHGRPGAGRALEDLPHAHERDALRGLVSAALSGPGGTRSDMPGRGMPGMTKGRGGAERRPGPSPLRQVVGSPKAGASASESSSSHCRPVEHLSAAAHQAAQPTSCFGLGLQAPQAAQ